MNQYKHRRTWRGFAGLLAAALTLSGCGLFGSANQPTEVKVTQPTSGSDVKVGQSIVIKGEAKGGAIGQLDIKVDGVRYAEQPSGTADGFPDMSIEAPWTPTSAGQHTIIISALAPKTDANPDPKEIGRSETLIVNAQAAAVPPTLTPPPAPTAVPTAAVVAPAATAGAGAGNTAPGDAAPGSDAPSLTVTNEFVNVRKGPGVGYDKLGELKQTEKAAVKGRSSDNAWYQVAFQNGTGWVIADYVSPNAAAKSVAVAEAPPPPVQSQAPAPAPVPVAQQPVANPVLVPLVPLAPVPAAPQPVAPAPASQPTAGGKNILRINQNPVPSGSTVFATWTIPNFKEGTFDKGDGAGFVGVIGGTFQVKIENVTSQRTIIVKWKDLSDVEQTDSLTIYITGQAVGAAPTPANNAPCDANSATWKGKANPDYTFCAARDMEYVTSGVNSVQNYNAGEDKSLTLSWSISGVAGLFFNVEGNTEKCGGSPGTGGFSQPVTGDSSHTFNVKTLTAGGYKLRMRVLKNGGGEVSYNEKFLCIGGSGGGGGGGTNPTSVPSNPGAKPTEAP
jgi:hypothetical protein